MSIPFLHTACTARTARTVGFAVLIVLAAVLGARAAHAQDGATITVNTTLDSKANDGACSLREAVISANTNTASGTRSGECSAGGPGRDLILLPPDAVYTLTRPAVGGAAADSGGLDDDGDNPETGDLHITSDLTIQPAGSGVVVIQGGPGFNSRIFHVTGGQPVIQGVSILWGGVNVSGGAIFNQSTLALNNSTVVRSAGVSAKSGIENRGTATLTNVTVNATAAGGAALANAAGKSLTLLDSIVANGPCTGTISGSGTTNVAYLAPGCPGAAGDPLLQPQTIPALSGVPAYYVPGEGGSAHNAGADADAGDAVACLLPADQLGGSRPQGPGCDSGAIELEDGFLEVTSCADAGPGTLRAALEASNATPAPETIIFDLPASCNSTIAPASALPAITAPVTVDGALQEDGRPNPNQSIVLDAGSQDFNGLEIQPGAGGTQVRSLTIRGYRNGIVILGSGEGGGGGGSTVENNTVADNLGSGIVIVASDGNTIRNNTINGNGFGGLTTDAGGVPVPLDDGITAISGVNNLIVNNNIYGNKGQAVDLGGDGPTPNDPGDSDGGPNFVQNHPVLFRAALGAPSGQAALQGWLDSRPGQSYTLRFYAGASCAGSALALVGESSVTTPAGGTVYFDAATVAAVQQGDVILATATDAAGNTSELAPCARVGYANDSWPAALPLNVTPGGSPATIEQYLDLVGQSRWYKIPITPGSRVRVELTNLPANYDLTVYKDIRQVYEDLNNPQGAGDLGELGAEFAADAFAAQGFAAQGFAAQGFAAQGFAAQGFAAQGFAAQGFAAQGFAAQGFAAQGFAAQGFAADAVSEVIFSPDAFLSQAFAAQGFAPDAYYPDAFDPAAFSDAPQRSLLGLSAFENSAPESLVVNTWANTGDFYIKVRGRQGAFSPVAQYQLSVTVEPGLCDALFADARLAQLNAMPAPAGAPAGNFTTLVLADWSRYDARFPAAELAAMKAQLAAFAARAEVRGVSVDVGAAAKVALANALGDQYVQCPYAKNLVAGAIKEIADASRAANPGLRYIVLIGGDDDIPFFRSPDTAPLGSESDFYPPVDDDTASQATLRQSYYMQQDGYGARQGISFKDGELPVPDLAVGRLLETPAEVRAAFAAYLATPDGVAPPPQNALVAGYDFMHDAALAVTQEFSGAGVATDALLTEPTVSPLVTSTTDVSASPFTFDGKSWTAGQLGTLLERRHDLAFLAGHFSAASALAADYSSAYAASQLQQSPVNLANALIFSNGCHSGYNTVLEHALPWTAFPSWPQVFVGKGAVLIGGTGYQYGDTDFLEYSERLYRDFARALRTGDGPIAIGDALMAAKRTYLAETPRLRGIHEKSLLQAAIYGLPMLKIDMPGSRYPLPETSSVVPALTPVASLPGSAPLLALHSADVNFTWAAMENRTLPLKDINDLEGDFVVTSSWLVGENGVVSNPGEPAVPLIVKDVSAPAAFPGYALRGVGLRSATYSDQPGVQPLVGAPTTELRGVHQNLLTPIWFPVTPWSVNYFDALESGAGGGTGSTRLNLQPAQYRAPSPLPATAIRRRYSGMNFRLYYSASTAANGANQPALSAPPSIVQVSSAVDGGNVRITVQVVANPGSGVQEVWATYTGTSGPYHGQWQSLDLAQNPADSTLWEGVVPLNGTAPAAFQFVVQAAGGNGLVGRSDNMGRYFSAAATGLNPATLTLAQAGASGPVGTLTHFTATLLSRGVPLANQAVAVALGGVTRVGVTGSDGTVGVGLPLLTVPGEYVVAAWFAGDATYAPTTAGAVPFTVTQQGTILRLLPDNVPQVVAPAGATLPFSATLTDAAGQLLPEQAVTIQIAGGAFTDRETVITDLVGRAFPRLLAPPPGDYTVTVEFPGNASYTGSTSNQLQLSVGEAPLVTLLPLVLNEGDPPGE